MKSSWLMYGFDFCFIKNNWCTNLLDFLIDHPVYEAQFEILYRVPHWSMNPFVEFAIQNYMTWVLINESWDFFHFSLSSLSHTLVT